MLFWRTRPEIGVNSKLPSLSRSLSLFFFTQSLLNLQGVFPLSTKWPRKSVFHLLTQVVILFFITTNAHPGVVIPLMLTQVVGCCWKGLRVTLNSTHGEQLEIHPRTMNISILYKLQGCKIEWRSGTKFAAFHLLPNLESKTPILTSSSSSRHPAHPDI